jgi:hypothetical protein
MGFGGAPSARRLDGVAVAMGFGGVHGGRWSEGVAAAHGVRRRARHGRVVGVRGSFDVIGPLAEAPVVVTLAGSPSAAGRRPPPSGQRRC